MPKRKKQPHVPAPPYVAKNPVSKWPTDDESRERISWRIGDMEFKGAWHWNGIKAAKWREIMEFLGALEKLTWGEATKGGRVKFVNLAEAPPGVQERLQAIQRDDTEKLVELRMSAKQRIWGVRRGNICHLLWWDPNHGVWPSKLKHT